MNVKPWFVDGELCWDPDEGPIRSDQESQLRSYLESAVKTLDMCSLVDLARLVEGKRVPMNSAYDENREVCAGVNFMDLRRQVTRKVEQRGDRYRLAVRISKKFLEAVQSREKQGKRVFAPTEGAGVEDGYLAAYRWVKELPSTAEARHRQYTEIAAQLQQWSLGQEYYYTSSRAFRVNLAHRLKMRVHELICGPKCQQPVGDEVLLPDPTTKEVWESLWQRAKALAVKAGEPEHPEFYLYEAKKALTLVPSRYARWLSGSHYGNGLYRRFRVDYERKHFWYTGALPLGVQEPSEPAPIVSGQLNRYWGQLSKILSRPASGGGYWLVGKGELIEWSPEAPGERLADPSGTPEDPQPLLRRFARELEKDPHVELNTLPSVLVERPDGTWRVFKVKDSDYLNDTPEVFVGIDEHFVLYLLGRGYRLIASGRPGFPVVMLKDAAGELRGAVAPLKPEGLQFMLNFVRDVIKAVTPPDSERRKAA